MTYKVPSEPTIRRVLPQGDVDEVDAIFSGWLAEESRRSGDAIAGDGNSYADPGTAHVRAPCISWRDSCIAPGKS
jgi:hypothetical protein